MKVRAAVHVHSEWSYHARWTLRAIATSFARRGYQVVFTSEHERGFDEARWRTYQRACREASDDRIALVPGLEYEDDENVVHLTVWGDRIPFLRPARTTIDLLRAASSVGAVSVFAHPWRRDAISRYRTEWGEHLTGAEIWNRQYDGVAPNARAIRFAAAEHLAPFAALDFHTRRQFFPLAMALDAGDRHSTSAVIAALRDRRSEPELFGFRALAFAEGIPGASLSAAEAARRLVRGPARHLGELMSRESVR